jgi:transcription-repair coupling factor (superfamily II helicase)
LKTLISIIKNSENYQMFTEAVSQNKSVDIVGVTPSFKPYFLAAAASLPNRGVLWVTASWDSCEKIYESAHPFFSEGIRERFGVFPEAKQTGDQDLTPSLRLRTLQMIAENRPCCIVAPYKSLLQECEEPGALKDDAVFIALNTEVSLDKLIDKLTDMGYSRNFQVERRGEFSVRGGILDIYPATEEPVRIEFFGDSVDSIRNFDLDSQVSTGKLEYTGIYPIREYGKKRKLLDILPENWVIIIDDPSVIKFRAIEGAYEEGDLWDTFLYELKDRNPVNIESWSGESKQGIEFKTRPVDSMGGNIELFLDNLKIWLQDNETVVVSTQHFNRFKGLFKEKGIGGVKYDPDGALKPGQVLLLPGQLHTGFYWLDTNLKIITDKDILGVMPRKKRVLRTWDRTKAVDLNQLKPGEKVVHLSHGIGRFVGLAHLEIQGSVRDFVEMEYHKGDKLFVPIQQLDLLQKYIGPDGRVPNLSKLGKNEWTKTRQKAKEAAEAIAEELIELYSEREQSTGHAYLPDSTWQWELEASFPFEETEDQDRVIDEVKKDMESTRPMDRLLCGDAGYGKTEVALRAAFKATQDGKQVALVAPTTVLASQHFETFSQRLKPFPVQVAVMSRFQSKAQQRQTSEKIKSKEVDIVIGTHRLLQKDIKFADLGLLIIDEEQHFGVQHKEKLKKIKANVDVLTMTATPIPRTLNLSMSGIRDLSLIQTPPEDRLPVKTHLHEYDSELVRSAIIRELERGGQVYFVHNRVQGIEKIAQDIRRLVPFARVAVGHGQMNETELEMIMMDFYEGAIDVLVCTTIIESGLDIPNVNTILVNNAHMFGLAQLYQLRGRVGRSHNQAYAYMLYPQHMSISEDAQKRLEVIKEFSHLGAGFQLAMKDLEIRGAGNILGAEQSGCIAAVGFDLYCQILKEAVEERRGIKRERKIDPPVVDLPLNAYIPEDYITNAQVKLEMYRKIADIDKIGKIDELKEEFRDRFGKIPLPLEHLFEAVKIKILAWDIGAPSIKDVQGKVQILIPGMIDLPLKQVQKLYEKSGVSSYFYRSVLTIEDLFGKPDKKSFITGSQEKDPPRTWIPKLVKFLEALMEMKNRMIKK